MSPENASNPAARRSFLKAGGAVAAGLLAGQAIAEPRTVVTSTSVSTPIAAGAMPTRNLGRMGYCVGIFILGGQAALKRRRKETIIATKSKERTRDASWRMINICVDQLQTDIGIVLAKIYFPLQ